MRCDTTTDVGRLLEAYDIGRPYCEALLPGGMFLKPVLVRSSQGSYVLRGHAFRNTAARFRFQAEVVNGAADAGIRCPRVLCRTDGRWGVSRGGRYWALHEFVEGRTRDWHEWLHLKRENRQALATLGAEVARLHDTLRRLAPSGDPSFPLDLPTVRFDHLGRSARMAASSIRELPVDCPASATREALADPRIGAAWTMLLRAARTRRAACLPRQIVHGDVSPVNLVFSAEDSRPAFIDWDCVHVGLRMYDALGDVVLRAPWDDPESHRLDLEEVAAYLEGYAEASETPLTRSEWECVPLFLAARQLEDIRQRAAVVASLPPERDREYAALIRMRLGFIEQLEPYMEGKGPSPWM